MATITFRVNLETVNRYSASQPLSPTDYPDNLKNTRSTWFPDLLNDNRALKHGDTFTVSGMQAHYLKTNFATSDDWAFLEIVTEEFP